MLPFLEGFVVAIFIFSFHGYIYPLLISIAYNISIAYRFLPFIIVICLLICLVVLSCLFVSVCFQPCLFSCLLFT